MNRKPTPEEAETFVKDMQGRIDAAMQRASAKTEKIYGPRRRRAAMLGIPNNYLDQIDALQAAGYQIDDDDVPPADLEIDNELAQLRRTQLAIAGAGDDDPPLTRGAAELLTALVQSGATSHGPAAKAVIETRAGGDDYQRAWKRLKELGYYQGRGGRTGGVWPSDKGHLRAAHI